MESSVSAVKIAAFLFYDFKDKESFMFTYDNTHNSEFICNIFKWLYENNVELYYNEHILLCGYTFVETGSKNETDMKLFKTVFNDKDKLVKNLSEHLMKDIFMVDTMDVQESDYTKHDSIIKDKKIGVYDMITKDGHKWSMCIPMNTIMFKLIDLGITKMQTMEEKIKVSNSHILNFREPNY
tara:strand:- start:3930 stop:4475 length:546 start_codon:yes stop_codon:yes gene_type:complete